MTNNNDNYSNFLDFFCKECKNNYHSQCAGQWQGFGFNITCTCNCHIDKKNVVLDEPCKPSNTLGRHGILNPSVEGNY
jgi:hypothetical protein